MKRLNKNRMEEFIKILMEKIFEILTILNYEFSNFFRFRPILYIEVMNKNISRIMIMTNTKNPERDSQRIQIKNRSYFNDS